MATQTRLTIRRAARFLKATRKAYMMTACCGLVLWSAVAAQASWSNNGMPFQGLGMNGMPFNGIPFQGLPRNGIPTQGVISTGVTTTAPTVPAVPQESLPWSTLSQRPLGTSLP